LSARPTKLFRQVLLSLLRPMAQAMIAHGVTLNMATEALKQALVEEAIRTARPSGKVTDSQISLLTGLHRKDVRRLRQENPAPMKRPVLNACALAIAHWTTQKRFLDLKGRPKRLRRTRGDGQPGFDALVKSAKIDLPPATVLQALKVHDAVSEDDESGLITLVQDAFVGGARSEEQLQAFEKNLRAHLEVATGNLLSDGDKLQFERAGHYNHLPEAATAELERKARLLAMEMLSTLNKLALKRQRQAEGDETAQGRFTIGAYVRSEADESDVTPQEGAE
jgi:hypothetical protein